jgi:hypothetical protein|tara:strand:+ start:357 stop:1382 length:1026 start_codon:yes stop_codon:yes gene_type:complete
MKNFNKWKKDSHDSFLIGIIGSPITLFLFFYYGNKSVFWLIVFGLISLGLLSLIFTNLPPHTELKYNKWKEKEKLRIKEEKAQKAKEKAEEEKQKREWEKNWLRISNNKFEKSKTFQSVAMSNYYSNYSMQIARGVVSGKTIYSVLIGIRLIVKDNLESYCFDVMVDGLKDWIFIRNGELQILINNKPYKLKAIEVDTNVHSNKHRFGDRTHYSQELEEKVLYMFDKTLLYEIYNSKKIEMRFTAGKGSISVEAVDAKRFKEVCVKFYDKIREKLKDKFEKTITEETSQNTSEFNDKFKLNSKTKSELIEFAASEFDIKLSKSATKADMVKKIYESYNSKN